VAQQTQSKPYKNEVSFKLVPDSDQLEILALIGLIDRNSYFIIGHL